MSCTWFATYCLFGRTADNPLRIGIIERDRTLPPKALFDRLAAEVEHVARRLGDLDDGAAAMRGVHPRLGSLTVPEIVDRFIGSHIEDHVAQLNATVDARSTSS